MRDFQVFITDDRYTVLTLHIVQAPCVERASELAERLLAGSVHHLAVEVFDEGRRVFAIGKTVDSSPTEPGV